MSENQLEQQAMPLSVGMRVRRERRFSAHAVRQFGLITGDLNPLHLVGRDADEGRFGRPIVHGMFAGAVFSSIIATDLPGPGSIYLSQALAFKAPLFFEETYWFRVEVVAVRPDRPVVELATVCEQADGKILIEGVAKVLFEG